MTHPCYRNPPIHGDETRTKWEHDDDPCLCQCDHCVEMKRIKALPIVDDADIDQLYELFVTGLSKGPWKATQLPGMGANNYIVSEHPKEQWNKVVAHLENPGNFDGMQVIAWCRDGVPMLLNTIKKLQQQIEDMVDDARDAAWERDTRD